MKKIAVFASGNGSNFQAIIDAINEGALEAQIEILVCDRKGAKCIERAEDGRNSDLCFFVQKTMWIKQGYEQEILQT